MIVPIMRDVVDFSLRYNLILKAAARAQRVSDSSELRCSIFLVWCTYSGTEETVNFVPQHQR